MAVRVLAVLMLGLCLSADGALAHDQEFPIPANKLFIKTKSGPSKQSFTFRSAQQPLIVPTHNPGTEGSAVLIRGTGATAASTALIQLDPALWKTRGKSPNQWYEYTDKTGSRGGVKKVVYKPGKKGGTLVIRGGGPGWPLAVAGAFDEAWVHFKVEDEWYCAEFGGTITKNEAGLFSAKNAPAPAACPATLCGNGILESGEECDDGNLDNGDGCATNCLISTCSGQSFNSTWEAIQTNIIQTSGCTNFLCHTGAPAAGGLNLESANAYANLIDVPSTASPLDRIEPGDQHLSFLYLKLAAATLPAQYPPGSVPGTPMPAGGFPPITTDALAALRLWIRAGAPETGVVEGTADLLDSCLPPTTPQKLPPLDPPPAGVGVQLKSGPWPLPAQSEDEVCFSTYHDFTGLVPASAQTPCPSWMGGPSQTCFRYHSNDLAQDPQSHHSIIHAYRGAYDTNNPGWGAWTCKGGTQAGTSCDPKGIGTPAPAGADCAGGGVCSGAIRSTVACILYGPPDYGFNNNVAPSFAGSQEPRDITTFADGVYNVVPLKFITVWNSHAFNLTNVDTTMDQYLNIYFADPADQVYQVLGIFDDTDIFVQNVPPFETREYCRTYTAPQYARIFQLTSHTHKRGVKFRIWGPPNAACSSAGGGTCLPNPGTPLYISTEYTDPVKLGFDPPTFLPSSTAADRRFKFCSLYNNGASDPSLVKRYSTSPEPPLPFVPGGPCAVSETRCIGGPQHNQLCNGNDAFCDSSAGGDGDCDACPLRGGVTTEDEMEIMIGSYYIAP